jgi:hypothetical protein
MEAPVYRHADSRATLLGLNFPGDFFAVVVTSYLWLMLLRPLPCLLAVAATYAAVALLNTGRPPQHWQHWLAFQLRRLLYRGELSAAARSRAPQFPFGPYRCTNDAQRHP